MNRYLKKKFIAENFATAGVDFAQTKYTSRQGSNIMVKIWDTGGQLHFRNIVSNYYRNADGVILTFSLTDEQSFKNLRDWI